MKKFYILIYFLIIGWIFCQVNTENMRSDNLSLGLKHQASIDFSYFSSDTEIIQLIGSYRTDFLTKSNWYGFLNGQYDRAFEKNNDDFSNRGFIHFRLAKPILNKIHLEGFLQKETNKFINLNNRELIGFGLRINHLKNLFLGTGAMYELEKYDDNLAEHKFLKSTNYINHKIHFLDFIKIKNVIYYQFKIEEFSNYRILWDGNFNFEINDYIYLTINTHYRFDNNGRDFFEITNGFGIQF